MMKSLSIILAVAAVVLAGGYMMTSVPSIDAQDRNATAPAGIEDQEMNRNNCEENNSCG